MCNPLPLGLEKANFLYLFFLNHSVCSSIDDRFWFLHFSVHAELCTIKLMRIPSTKRRISTMRQLLAVF